MHCIKLPVRIPLDIIDEVIRQILHFDYNTRISALKSCALACKDFGSLTHRHRLHTISFSFDRPNVSQKVQNFQSFLQSSPELSRHVKELCLYDDGRNPTFICQSTLSHVLTLLRNVEKFELRFERCYNWNNLNPSVMEALTNSLFSTSIESLTLGNITNIPHTFGRHFIYIPNLHLTSIDFTTEIESYNYENGLKLFEEAQKRTGGIKSLSLSNVVFENLAPFISALLSCPPPLIMPYAVPEAISRIIEKHGKSITRLDFPLIDSTYIIDVGILPRLSTLQFVIDFTKNTGHSVLNSFAYSVLHTNKGNHIGEIIMKVKAATAIILAMTKLSEWSILDETLSGPMFSRLRKVTVDVYPVGTLRRALDNNTECNTIVSNIMCDLLPKLHHQNMVQTKVRL
ncbi:hypothetical protein BDQ17DRAFT_1363165 [Cyathus striatus]|nr:hypothetical protein BDQ17DRAFT_1363165 [Cyathus striatus]